MQDIIDMVFDFIQWYHTEIVNGYIKSFFGSSTGLVLVLVVLWCFLYTVGFAVARHKKINMNGDDIIGSFLLGGFIFVMLILVLLIGGGVISLIIGFVVPLLLVYVLTSMILKGIDARK